MSKSIICDHCERDVPVAPHFYNVSVPHVAKHPEWPDTTHYQPCVGNQKREWRDALGHPAEARGRQYMVFDDDRYWEGL